MHKSESGLLVVTDGADAPVGYALLSFRIHARMANLNSIAILPNNDSLGLGSLLLGRCESWAQARKVGIRLEVRADNPRAIGFYQQRGYEQFGERPNYYEDGQSALLFRKLFTSSEP